VVVLKPEAIRAEGTIVTDQDAVDTLFHREEIDAAGYMGRAYTGQDFLATAGKQLLTKNSASGSTKDGVFIPNRMAMSEVVNGADGDYDSMGVPHFSTWEVKMPEASYDNVDRLIFRTEAARDEYLRDNPDNTTPYAVEPSIKDAMHRGEDIFGTHGRREDLLDEKMTADYAIRKAALDQVPDEEKTVEYKRVNARDTIHHDPAWSSEASHATAEEITENERRVEKAGQAVMSLFMDDDEIESFDTPPAPIRIARITRHGGTAVIQEINEY
jgi:hypothetical protein